jgi:cobalt-zinc-cadmium efflux system membrane fusion protein
VWVNVTVYARDLARIRIGQAVEVRAEGIEQPAGGTITYLGQVVGEETRSATARVILENPGRSWRPGLFVTAHVAVDRASALVVVADDAVQRVEGKEVVFVEEEGAFEARPITMGRRGSGGAENGTVVEVLSGVASGERYVAGNSIILKAELGKSEAGHEH